MEFACKSASTLAQAISKALTLEMYLKALFLELLNVIPCPP
jgi:hypothetical protein